MPFLLIVLGAILTLSGVHGTEKQLFSLVKNDFFPAQGHGFIYWVMAIAVVGGLGYVPKLESLSRWFMLLLIIVLIVSHGGVFQKLQQVLHPQSAAAFKRIRV